MAILTSFLNERMCFTKRKISSWQLVERFKHPRKTKVQSDISNKIWTSLFLKNLVGKLPDSFFFSPTKTLTLAVGWTKWREMRPRAKCGEVCSTINCNCKVGSPTHFLPSSFSWHCPLCPFWDTFRGVAWQRAEGLDPRNC